MKKNNVWKKAMVLAIIGLFLGASVFVPSILGFGTGNEDNGDKQGDWEIETVDGAGDTGWCTSIALDSNNYPHISYGNSDNNALKYAKWNGAIWDIETVDSPGFGWTSIALDSNDYPHIAYPNQDSEYQKYAKWNGATWEIEIVDSVWSYYSSIALDNNDYPHISYREMNNDDLKYAKWNGATWDIETVDSVGDVGEYCSLALDSSDYPHISYGDKDNDALKHAWWDGTIWHIETVEVIPGSYNVCYTSIAVDSNDKSHIAYKDYESDDLKYAKNTAGTWETEIVDSTGDTGWYLSIALDSSDYPHISFSDWPGYNYRLKYAKWDGTEWGIEIVDTAVDAGKFTSIALDSYDCPHISYNDGNLDDLKYAKKAPTNNPPYAPTISGPTNGAVGEEYEYTFVATDPDGDNVKYGWDWDGDNIVDEWTGFYSSGETITTSHSWDTAGTYNVKVKAEDSNGAQSSFSNPLQVVISSGNQLPDIPDKPFGATSVIVHHPHRYQTSAVDPDGDRVQYYFDWGDGEGDWTIGFVESGETDGTDHIWREPGVYQVKAKARDEPGAESGWSEPLTVTVEEEVNHQPNKPTKPSGQESGKAGVKYNYSTSAVDPDGDQIKYYLWD